jgi:hypothetical protein
LARDSRPPNSTAFEQLSKFSGYFKKGKFVVKAPRSLRLLSGRLTLALVPLKFCLPQSHFQIPRSLFCLSQNYAHLGSD